MTEQRILSQAQRLAEGLHEQHWAQDAPQWKVGTDMKTVLLQIDNMTAGLVRSKPQ